MMSTRMSKRAADTRQDSEAVGALLSIWVKRNDCTEVHLWLTWSAAGGSSVLIAATQVRSASLRVSISVCVTCISEWAGIVGDVYQRLNTRCYHQRKTHFHQDHQAQPEHHRISAASREQQSSAIGSARDKVVKGHRREHQDKHSVEESHRGHLARHNARICVLISGHSGLSRASAATERVSADGTDPREQSGSLWTSCTGT